MRCFALALLGSSLLVTTGCGKGGGSSRPTVAISGKVVFAGQPLDDATITFDPADGKGAPASARIDKGAYSANVQTGPKVIRIASNRTSPEVVTSATPAQATIKEAVPDIYNAKSTLKKEVQTAEDGVDFTLDSGIKK